jgi:hypothetical protein
MLPPFSWSKRMMYAGIDVGVSGGIALIGESEPICVKFKDRTDRDLWEIIRDMTKDVQTVLIERVNTMPHDGRVGAFNFGLNYGILRGALAAANPRYGFVSPAKWQRHFGLIKKKGETNVQKKNRHKAVAQQLFSVPVFHWNADALLIAEYARVTS